MTDGQILIEFDSIIRSATMIGSWSKMEVALFS